MHILHSTKIYYFALNLKSMTGLGLTIYQKKLNEKLEPIKNK